MVLTATASPPAPVSNVDWTSLGSTGLGQVPTTTGQTFTNPLGTESPSPNPSLNPITYYWLSGGSNVVWVKANVNYNGTAIPMIAIAPYNVESPALTSQSLAATFLAPSIASPPPFWIMELGNAGNPPSSVGLTSTYTATAPTHYPGWYAESQVVSNNPSPMPTAPSPYPWATTSPFPPATYWADGCAIYGVEWVSNGWKEVDPTYGNANQGTVQFGPTLDAPDEQLSDTEWNLTLQSLYADDKFIDSFIFRPAVSVPSIWVVISQLSWDWGGLAASSGGNSWAYTDPISPGGTTGGTLYGKPSSNFVGWPNALLYSGASECPDTELKIRGKRSRPATTLSEPTRIPRS